MGKSLTAPPFGSVPAARHVTWRKKTGGEKARPIVSCSRLGVTSEAVAPFPFFRREMHASQSSPTPLQNQYQSLKQAVMVVDGAR